MRFGGYWPGVLRVSAWGFVGIGLGFRGYRLGVPRVSALGFEGIGLRF